jgi:glycosyltransferase involved in cell wall biosynthesis
MSKTIWYISKYVQIPNKDSSGGRGWQLMKEFSKRGYETVIITSKSQHFNINKNFDFNIINFSNDGIKFIVFKTLNYVKSRSIRRVLSWLNFECSLFFLNKNKLNKPDVIIISSLSLLTILNGVFLRRKYNCKLVFEIRDIWPLTLVELGNFSKNNMFVLILKIIEKWGYKKSDFIVGTMPNLAEHVKKVLGYSKNVYCIPMGIDIHSYNNNQKVNKDYINKFLNTGCFNIIYTGNIGVANALETFLKTASKFKEDSRFKFILVGDGDLKNLYLKKYSHLQNLIFAPKVKKNEVQSVLSHASIVYFATSNSKIYDYGISLNKIIDYMVSKKPILASYSGYPSMINEAGCGFFIPAEDVQSLVNKIKELFFISDSERETLGLKGFNWLLKNRKYEMLADNYLKLIFK